MSRRRVDRRFGSNKSSEEEDFIETGVKSGAALALAPSFLNRGSDVVHTLRENRRRGRGAELPGGKTGTGFDDGTRPRAKAGS